MQRQMLKSKIHRATVTGCDLDYVGSVTIDADLLEASDILVNELVHVWNITNGSRFVTYAILGERGSGEIRINGAAAHLVNEQDLVIIASYADYDERDLQTYAPVVVHVDAENAIKLVDSNPEILLAHGPSAADEIPGALSGESFDDVSHYDGSLG